MLDGPRAPRVQQHPVTPITAKRNIKSLSMLSFKANAECSHAGPMAARKHRGVFPASAGAICRRHFSRAYMVSLRLTMKPIATPPMAKSASVDGSGTGVAMNA